MAKKKQPPVKSVAEAPLDAPSMNASVPREPGEPVVQLVVDGVNARGLRCPSGTVISPNVDCWPDHRVAAHLRTGRAVRVPAHGE